ncbi:MFS transporter [Sulfurimonas sp.]|uniref:MFS transporter n=1 Tax=Sulfurimonas sp. TaxID=2022749 RepID=UPI002B491C07|nr:MFS transporter [Sulfurimonas sp.]
MQKKDTLFGIVGLINYLIVIFLNAFTDLGHKIIIQNTIFKIYDGDTLIVLTAIVNALILLPFILIFSPSGFLADRFPKNKIMEYSSIFAIFITLGITYSYYHGHFYTAFGMTFMIAFQSAIYGPAKYGYIKELVGIKFISAGNGAIQAVTTVAILGGIIFYTVLFEGMLGDSFQTKEDILKIVAPLGWLLVIGSIVEWFLASKLPNKMIESSKKSFNVKRYLTGAYLHKNMKIIKRKKEIFEAILALSLFWSISQVVLAVFGEYAKSKLGVTNTIFVQGVMALAGIGIVIGSIMAAKFSKYFINTGLSALGAVGLTLVVFFIPTSTSLTQLGIIFMLFGIFSGFLMVPLNAQIQFLSPRVHLGTILAGNNFIQNIFMFSFLVLTTIFAYHSISGGILIYAMAIVGLMLSFLLLKRYIVMTFWAFMELISSFRHSYTYVGLQNIPSKGAVLLLGNHVSWLDWVIVQLPLSRRINFLMDKDIYHWKFFHAFFKKGEAIPVSPKASKDAFKEAYKRLLDAKVVGIFPEGEISIDGKLGKFYRGYELISSDYKGVIVPYFIDGVFGSSFSKYKNKNKKSFFKRREITVYFAPPIPNDTKADDLKSIIQELKDRYETK